MTLVWQLKLVKFEGGSLNLRFLGTSSSCVKYRIINWIKNGIIELMWQDQCVQAYAQRLTPHAMVWVNPCGSCGHYWGLWFHFLFLVRAVAGFTCVAETQRSVVTVACHRSNSCRSFIHEWLWRGEFGVSVRLVCVVYVCAVCVCVCRVCEGRVMWWYM